MLKTKRTGLAIMVFILMGLVFTYGRAVPVNAAEIIEANGTAFKMVLTEKGGVTLNINGVSNYFKVWDRGNDTLTRISLPWDNILSYDVDGDKLYFIVNYGSYTQIHQYNLSTGTHEPITAVYTNKQRVQANSGRVAWMDYGSSAIFIRDMNSGQEQKVEIPPSTEVEIALTENYLAYTAHKMGGDSSVRLFDLATEELTTIKGGSTIKSGIYMQGHRIVWVEGGGYVSGVSGFYNLIWGNYVQRQAMNKIYLYDLWTGETELLTNNDVNNLQPMVWENYVAWTQTFGGSPEIMLMNLDDREITRITTNDYLDVLPTIENGIFTYISAHGITGDINVQYLNATNAPAPTTNAEVSIYVNGAKLSSDTAPYIKDAYTMAPIRVISEHLGAEVYWNAETYTVEIFKDKTSIYLVIGDSTARVNGEMVTLQAPPELNNGRTMVPLRFVGEALGCNVSWNNDARSVVIQY